jgi:hypothetical protein
VLFVITVIAANAWQGARDFSDAPVHGALLGAAAAVAALFVCGLTSWIFTQGKTERAKYGFNSDTNGEIARAMEWAFQAGVNSREKRED